MSDVAEITPPLVAIEMQVGHKGRFNLSRSARILYFEDVAWVELTQGKWALIDLASVLVVAGHAWSANWSGERFYATTKIDGKNLGMHRLLLGECLLDSQLVDHRDGNGLNNRLSNLRACTNAENVRNSKCSRANRSGLKGVSFRPSVGRYVSRIRVDGREKYLGCFLRAEDAHAAYINAAHKHFGEFANDGGEAGFAPGSRRAEG